MGMWKKRQTNQRYISVGQILTVFIRIHLYPRFPSTFPSRTKSARIPLNNKQQIQGEHVGPWIWLWKGHYLASPLCTTVLIKSFHRFSLCSSRRVCHKTFLGGRAPCARSSFITTGTDYLRRNGTRPLSSGWWCSQVTGDTGSSVPGLEAVPLPARVWSSMHQEWVCLVSRGPRSTPHYITPYLAHPPLGNHPSLLPHLILKWYKSERHIYSSSVTTKTQIRTFPNWENRVSTQGTNMLWELSNALCKMPLNNLWHPIRANLIVPVTFICNGNTIDFTAERGDNLYQSTHSFSSYLHQGPHISWQGLAPYQDI